MRLIDLPSGHPSWNWSLVIHKIKVNNYCHLRVQKQIWLLMMYWDTYEVKRMVCARNVTLFTTVLQSDLVNFVHHWNEPVLKNDWFANQSSLWTVCLRLWITENNVVNNCTDCLVHFIRPHYIISSHGNSFCIACIFFFDVSHWLAFYESPSLAFSRFDWNPNIPSNSSILQNFGFCFCNQIWITFPM